MRNQGQKISEIFSISPIFLKKIFTEKKNFKNLIHTKVLSYFGATFPKFSKKIGEKSEKSKKFRKFFVLDSSPPHPMLSDGAKS